MDAPTKPVAPLPAEQRVQASRLESGAGSAPAIDAAHLAQMTLGERSLQREVLALFDRQAELLLPRIRSGPDRAAATHTLKGSAMGIGALRVARAAEAVERADTAAIEAAVERLAAALEEAKAEIARLLAR